MAGKEKTQTSDAYQEAGWKIAYEIADMLDGQDRTMAIKIVENAQNAAREIRNERN